MLLGFVMPITLGGIANYFLPIVIGVPDLVFARMNNTSFLMYVAATVLLVSSLYVEEGIGLG
jgi:heme/copper-type cytochrome/quinol oxidase subunit 1